MSPDAIDNDAFYKAQPAARTTRAATVPRTSGATSPAPQAQQAQGRPPALQQAAPLPHIEGDAFYGAPAPAPRPHFWQRAAQNPYLFAAFLLGIGSGAVFVAQAPFLYQVVLGAPIFEEALKFGLALLVALSASVPARTASAWMARLGSAIVLGAVAFGTVAGLGVPWPASAGTGTLFAVTGLLVPFAALRGASPALVWPFRLLCAAAVGAGFGVLEHWVTYSGEDGFQFSWRVAFHSLSTLLSMAAYTQLERAADVRERWAATLPSTLVHYLNNAGALLLVLLAALLGVPISVASFWSYTLTFALAALVVVALAARPLLGRLGSWLAARLPV